MSITTTSMAANITAALQFSGSTATSSTATAAATAASVAANPATKLLDAQITRDGAKLSSIGKVALALDDFKTIASSLTAGGLTLAASTSGTSATAQLSGTGATAGTHTVDVKQLAQGQQLTSKTLSSHTAALGTGATTQITVKSGSGTNATTTTVSIDSSNNTLDGIAKAMQDAGIDAKVVVSGKGYALSMTGDTGAANTMKISVSGDAALKGLLNYGTGTTSAMTQTAAAQDAQATVDGKAVTSATNTLATAATGLSLTLTGTGKSTVTIAGDASAMAANVKSFVTAYNTLTSTLGTLKSANSDTSSTVNSVLTQMASSFSGTDKTALSALGITIKNGSLVLSESKLNAAIAANPTTVAQTFSNSGTGLADKLGTQVAQQMATGGLLAKQSAAVQTDMDKLTTQKTKVAATLTRQATLLASQYTSSSTSLFGLSSGSSTASLFDLLA